MPVQVFGAEAAVATLNRVFANTSIGNAAFNSQLTDAKSQMTADADPTDIVSYAAFGKAFGAAYTSQTPFALAKLMLTNMGALPSTDPFILQMEIELGFYIEKAGIDKVGIVALQLCSIISSYETKGGIFTAWNAPALAWNNEVTAAYSYSSNPANTASLTGDVFTLTTDSPTITEGDSGSKLLIFSLNLDRAPTSDVVINYQTLTSGTASAGDDFVPAANTVTFAAGQTVATVAITINGDTAFEPNETINVRFSGSKLAGSVTATGTITNNDIDVANQTQIFTLTAGADTIPGLIGSNGTSSTTGNDTISAIIENSGTNGASNTSTLNSGDTLNAGSGADVLNVRVISLTGAAAATPVLTSVETVSVSNSDVSTNNATINLASATGTTTVEFKNNAIASMTTFLNVANAAVISLNNADSSSIGQNVNFGLATGRTGTADAFAITIANGSGASDMAAGFNLVAPDGTTDDTSFEVANITVAGTSSFVVAGTAAAALTSLNLSGTSTGVTSGYGLTLSQVTGFDNLRTVNASGLVDGGLNIDASGSSATGFSFTGSNSNDRVVLTNTTLNTAGALTGGGGSKDTLAATSFNLTASVVNSATGFEVLESVNPESSLVANSFTKINEFLFSGGPSNSNRINITGVESTDRFVFASDQAGNSDEPIRFTGANVGTTVLFELRASTETGGEVIIIADDHSTDNVSAIGFQGNVSAVTIDSTGQNANANLIESVNWGLDNYWAFNNENGLANFTITGSQALTIGAKEGVDLSSGSKTAGFHNSANVNASAFTSFLRIAGSNSDDVITGGSGMDIIYGLGGADTLTGNGGDDHFRMTGNSGADVIKDFVVGTDKIGINNVDFANTTATSVGATLAAADYVSNRTGITSIGASDDNKVIELQATFSTSQIESDVGAAVQAYVIVFNSTTGKGELWFDNNWGDDGGRSLVATFDNVLSLTGVTSFGNSDFVEFIA